MELTGYIACICEGSSEAAILDILIDHELLCFSRTQMLDEKVLRCRSAEKFENNYLRKGFHQEITVVRVLDSRRENFRLRKEYQSKVKVINIVTAPEIEMLIILNEDKYEEYCKSHKKPSDFCKENLRMKDVKSYRFVREYFTDPGHLVSAIRKYQKISNRPKDESTLMDLLQ